MNRTYDSRLAVVSLVVAALGSAVVLRTTSGEQPEGSFKSPVNVQSPAEFQACEDDFPKFEGRRTGIPEIDAEIVAENQRKLAEYGRARDERVRAEVAKQRDIWQGSTVDIPMYDSRDEWIYTEEKAKNPKFVIPTKYTKEELAELETIAEVFRKDVPAPPARLATFAEYFVPGAEIKCNGWWVALGHAVDVEDGWIVEIGVRPKICDSKGYPVIILGLNTLEVWHISQDGEATCQSVKPPTGRPIKYLMRL